VTARTLLAGLLLAGPVGAAGLEPRFDHRDQVGLGLELALARDSVAISGQPTRSHVRQVGRLTGSLDLAGEGNELIAGLELPVDGFSDPDRSRILLAGSLRYRGYFGLEELKTFFDVGIWASARSRVAVGPAAGLGLQYDFSRAVGLFTRLGFATGLGAARVASLEAGIGLQVRFDG
jgi:hypothetical protein